MTKILNASFRSHGYSFAKTFFLKVLLSLRKEWFVSRLDASTGPLIPSAQSRMVGYGSGGGVV